MLWTVAVVGLPFVAAIALVTGCRHSGPRIARVATLTASILTLVAAAVLLQRSHEHVPIAFEWLPGAGTIGLALSSSSLWLVLAIAGIAALALLGDGEFDAPFRNTSWALIMVALSAGFAALLVDHFIARYVVLEVAALCAGLAPLAELPSGTAGRLVWRTYLPLRVGDAGLLVGILLLGEAAGTLNITLALEAGATLGGASLAFAVGGLVLAAWIKAAGWPMHLWALTGRRLSLSAHAVLFATLLPTLGLYLLYRTAPLLVLVEPLRLAALWIGAGSATLSALGALLQSDQRTAQVYVGAAQAGLCLLAAASGLQTTLLLAVFVLMPLRLLSLLTADAAERACTSPRRRLAAGVFALGGLISFGFSLTITWWVRTGAAGELPVPLAAVLLAEFASALTAVWVFRTVWQLAAGRRPSEVPDWPAAGVCWPQWASLAVLGGGALISGLGCRELASRLMGTSEIPWPSALAILRYAATAPALPLVAVAALGVLVLRRRLNDRAAGRASHAPERLQTVTRALRSLIGGEGAQRASERAVTGAARLATAVERGGLEALLGCIGHLATKGPQLVYQTIEQGGLTRLLSRTANLVAAGSQVAYQAIEHGGLEALLGRVVATVLKVSRSMQAWHTGRLRRNLLYVTLMLAILVAALLAWEW
ncbi:MAG: hypothetical protein GX601_01440 [Anaerolineales bacterium]|nr:hypothetical protein [Anaerolineales bacterium]